MALSSSSPWLRNSETRKRRSKARAAFTVECGWWRVSVDNKIKIKLFPTMRSLTRSRGHPILNTRAREEEDLAPLRLIHLPLTAWCVSGQQQQELLLLSIFGPFLVDWTRMGHPLLSHNWIYCSTNWNRFCIFRDLKCWHPEDNNIQQPSSDHCPAGCHWCFY